MRRLMIAVASIVGLAALMYFAIYQFGFFSRRTDSDVAFLRVDASIGAFEGESVELMLPYAINASMNDPLQGRYADGGEGDNVPVRYAFSGLPATVTSHRIERAAQSGRYDVRMLYVALRFDRSGTYRAERLMVTYADGASEAYPLGDWSFEVLEAQGRQDLAVEEGYATVSERAQGYTLPLRNLGEETVWVDDVSFGDAHAAQSLTLAPGDGMQIDFPRDALVAAHRKSVLRIVRPIVSYYVQGQPYHWLPPAAHLGFTDIDHNAVVQEMDERRQARAVMDAVPADDYDLAANDPDLRLARLASDLTARGEESLLAVLRQERYRPADVRKWLESGRLSGFSFVYDDGTTMAVEDARLVWALRMARYLEEGGYLEDWDAQGYPAQWMGEWLLSSASWEEQITKDLHGQAMSRELLSALTLLRNARISTIGAGREIAPAGAAGG